MNWLTGNRKRLSPKTTGRRLTSLRAFGKWAKWGKVLEDYSAPPIPAGVPHPLPEGMDGIRRMLAKAKNDDQRALVCLCGMCGCRVFEARAVRSSDFDLIEMTLLVHGKFEKERIVPVSTEAWEILVIPVTRACIAGDTVVVNLKDRFARKVVTDLGLRAGLRRRVSSHDLRATFATEIFNKTLDIRLTQILLGHASVETTQLYTGITMDKMRKAVEI